MEPTGEVLGRSFFVMERLDGEVWEQQPIPPEMEAEPGRLRRMGESLVDQLAAIHLVDLAATGLHSLGDGTTFVDDELDRWEGEMRRVQRGPLPAMERVIAELRRQQPESEPARSRWCTATPSPATSASTATRCRPSTTGSWPPSAIR